MTNNETLDPVFHALADPTRRAVVRRLTEGPGSVSELAEPFDMALPTFLQHLKVLEKARLIRTVKQGRTRMCSLEAARLGLAEDWLAGRRAEWEAKADRFEAYVMELAKRRQKDV